MKSFKTFLLLLLAATSLIMTQAMMAEEQYEEITTDETIAEEIIAEEQAEEEPTEEELAAQQAAYMKWSQDLWDSMTPRTGGIALKSGLASLNVPQSFYYLSPEDAEKVLVEIWGNPPGQGSESLGMLFPEEYTPFDEESWAVTIDYEESGYITDDDAGDLDYDDLLEQMQEDTQTWNSERAAEGFEPIELVGWASTPSYDSVAHKAYWAKELKFGNAELNTLNYNVRILGRKGVLVLNFIASMEQTEIIDGNVSTVLNIANFSDGSKYEDFNPETDEVAGYGIAGMVSGNPEYAAFGIIALAILMAKKFGVFILAGLGALGAFLFKRKKAAS